MTRTRLTGIIVENRRWYRLVRTNDIVLLSIDVRCSATTDGVDCWLGTEQLTGLDPTTGLRSHILRVETPTEAEVLADIKAHEIMTATRLVGIPPHQDLPGFASP
jgi:hypothetical protein